MPSSGKSTGTAHNDIVMQEQPLFITTVTGTLVSSFAAHSKRSNDYRTLKLLCHLLGITKSWMANGTKFLISDTAASTF